MTNASTNFSSFFSVFVDVPNSHFVLFLLI